MRLWCLCKYKHLGKTKYFFSLQFFSTISFLLNWQRSGHLWRMLIQMGKMTNFNGSRRNIKWIIATEVMFAVIYVSVISLIKYEDVIKLVRDLGTWQSTFPILLVAKIIIFLWTTT